MKKKQTGDSGLLHQFDEARKSLRNFAIRMRSWGTFHDSKLAHDGFDHMAQLLHSDRDDLEDRNSMLQAFAERVAVVSKGTTNPEQIQALKQDVLASYDVTVQELDEFASEAGTTGYPILDHTLA